MKQISVKTDLKIILSNRMIVWCGRGQRGMVMAGYTSMGGQKNEKMIIFILKVVESFNIWVFLKGLNLGNVD